MKLTIKQKLYVIVSLVILGLLGLYLENAANQTKVANLVEIKSELKDLQIAMLQLRRSEKDFLLRKNVKYQQTFSDTFKHALQLINGLEQRLAATDFAETNLTVIKNGLQSYQQIFQQLISSSTAKGLDKNSVKGSKKRNI